MTTNRSRWAVLILLSWCCIGRAKLSLAQGDQEVESAAAEIRQVLDRHQFDPALVSGPFDRTVLDPRIIEFEWNGVEGEIETILNRRLNIGKRPISLPCVFRPLPEEGRDAPVMAIRLIPVFVFEQGNGKAKQALKIGLGLRDDALWDYQPATGRIEKQVPVQEYMLTQMTDFNLRYVSPGGELDLVKVQAGLQEMVRSDDNLLKTYKLATLSPHIVQGKSLSFATVWKLSWYTTKVAYGWRMRVLMVKSSIQEGLWDLTTKIEVGRRYSSQTDFVVIGDSDKGELSLLSRKAQLVSREGKFIISAGKIVSRNVVQVFAIEGEPTRAEVPPPIARVKAEDSSPLDYLSTVLMDECTKKLLIVKKP